jgi:hypothetical protein
MNADTSLMVASAVVGRCRAPRAQSDSNPARFRVQLFNEVVICCCRGMLARQ